ncbi:glycosyltransferase [Halorientalis pallida]|uniref:Glycosyltransferase family 1 protein n=1 Tax=Halorientalis pallida TaxID=2479928 RepID=A0A498KZG1_9EURY|nr:glycosyltransferase [Halorientalis pallida]RXK47443.1 glycosyltransferase family 1 protein [Halorientalis pallida]
MEVDTDLSELTDQSGDAKWGPDQQRRLEDWVTPVSVDADDEPLKDLHAHSEMVRQIRAVDCDVIHAWNIWSAIWASFSGTPYIYHITGHYDWQRDRHVDSTLFRIPLYVLVKRAIRGASVVVGLGKWLSDFRSRYDRAETAELDPLLATELFHPAEDTHTEHDGLELFAGARHDWETKRNDVMFEALAGFNGSDVQLTTIEWGNDVDRSKRLVSELGLQDSVTFAPLMSKPRLARDIRHADAVLDQFRFGFGSLARQSLACGTPLISAVDESRWEHPPPIMRASTPEEVRQRLGELETESDDARERSVAWIDRHYDQESLMNRYVDLYERHAE